MKELEIFFLLGNIKRIKRSWCSLGFAKAQNVAEHSYRVALLGYFLAKKIGANTEKVMLMSLLHDVPEILCGDINNIQREFSDRKEDLAFAKIFYNHPELLDIWGEYRAKQTLESKIVEDADSLEALLEILENYDNNRELFDKFLSHKNEKLDKLHLPITRSMFISLLSEETKPLDWINHFLEKTYFYE